MIEWAGIGLIAVGQVYTWLHNGSEARKAAAENQLATNRAIDKRITETEKLLTSEINGMKEICAGARASYSTRLDGHDRELKEIKED